MLNQNLRDNYCIDVLSHKTNSRSYISTNTTYASQLLSDVTKFKYYIGSDKRYNNIDEFSSYHYSKTQEP